HPESGGSAAAGPLAEYVASNGATFVHYNVAADTVPDGHRVRFQVMHFGAETARITSGTAKAFAWPTGPGAPTRRGRSRCAGTRAGESPSASGCGESRDKSHTRMAVRTVRTDRSDSYRGGMARSPTGLRDRLLKSALRLFTQRGYRGTSLADIAADVGCSKASLLYHFTTKEAILAELLLPIAKEAAALDARL